LPNLELILIVSSFNTILTS